MNKEKEIKVFRKFLIKYFNLSFKQKNRLILRVSKKDIQFADFLKKIRDFNRNQQQELLSQYDNPEVNKWLWGL